MPPNMRERQRNRVDNLLRDVNKLKIDQKSKEVGGEFLTCTSAPVTVARASSASKEKDTKESTTLPAVDAASKNLGRPPFGSSTTRTGRKSTTTVPPAPPASGTTSRVPSARRGSWPSARPGAAIPNTSPTIYEDLPLEPVHSPASEKFKEQCKWQLGKYTIRADFDSANLAKAKVGPSDHEFELWTQPDNGGTPYETGHRTWFYFGISGFSGGEVVFFTMKNLNKQSKLYSNDFRPVFRSSPSMNRWERSQQQVVYNTTDEGNFEIRFKHKFTEATDKEVFFAFCYPFSCTENE
ncbi:hypothetical protein CYMTET_30071, partial [Cymbomonas tetramitiformis]